MLDSGQLQLVALTKYSGVAHSSRERNDVFKG